MVGKKSGKALLREEGLERTDNNLDLTTWPQVNMINQKNYYTDYLKRDDQYLAYRSQNEDARNRMVQQARDKDRALAGVGTDTVDDSMMEDGEPSAIPEAAGSRLVVIHPGSQNLRIGLGTDALPKSVPMCIARRWKVNESEEGDGEPLPKRLKIDGEVPEEPEKWFGEDFVKEFSVMSSELKIRMRNNKRKLLPNSKELVLNYNKRARYEEISEHNDPNRIEWTEIPDDPKDAPDFFAGHEALRIPENSNPRYKLFWPIRHGWFNEKDYDTKTQLHNDIAVIIEQALKTQLGLVPKDLSQYSCVFIIPDLYERNYVTTLLHLLIRDLGFGRVCFQQESLAATFGAGYSNGCIVDIGHQKTSICCVDEGLCIEDSRVNVKMGGADVTETFLKMTLTNYFPYSEINLKRRYDLLLAEELKHRFCTMQEQEIAPQLWEFYLRAAGQSTRKYTFRTYDEPMLAPLGYFKPVIFDHSTKLEGRRKLIDRSYDLYDGQPNDPTSAAQETVYAFATGRTGAEAASAAEPKAPSVSIATPSRQPHSLLSRLNEAEGTPKSSNAGSPVPEGTPQPAEASSVVDGAAEAETGKIFNDPILKVLNEAEERDRIVPIMPLDMAILTSITQGARSDERKMRDFFGGIMLIGGGCKISGLGQYLEERLRVMRPGFTKEILIGPPPRELDPAVVAWKGGSVFGKLSSSGNDSWINQKEYDVLGSRLLVHKCMFPW